jgi:hypothetical protein
MAGLLGEVRVDSRFPTPVASPALSSALTIRPRC